MSDMTAIRIATGIIAADWLSEARILGEDTRVYGSNISDLGNFVRNRENAFYSAPSTKEFAKVFEEHEKGGPLPTEAQAYAVIRSFTFFLSDVAVAVNKEQRARLDANKSNIPLMYQYLNFPDNAETFAGIGRIARAGASQSVELASASTAYSNFFRLAEEEQANAARAAEIREAKRRGMAVNQPTPETPTAQQTPPGYTPSEAAAEQQSLTQTTSIEEQVSEYNIDALSAAKPFFKKYGWWILGGVAAFFAWKYWRSRQRR